MHVCIDTFIQICMYTYIYIYIQLIIYICVYIFIVIRRQTCFVPSELTSVARHTRFPKLGSKPG